MTTTNGGGDYTRFYNLLSMENCKGGGWRGAARETARSGLVAFFLNILNMNELAEVWLNLRRVCAGTYIFKKSGRRDWGTSRPQHAVSPDAFPGGDF